MASQTQNVKAAASKLTRTGLRSQAAKDLLGLREEAGKVGATYDAATRSGRGAMRRRASQTLGGAFGGMQGKMGAMGSGAVLAGSRQVQDDLNTATTQLETGMAKERSQAVLDAKATQFETTTAQKQIDLAESDRGRADLQLVTKQIGNITENYGGFFGDKDEGRKILNELAAQYVNSPEYDEIVKVIHRAKQGL